MSDNGEKSKIQNPKSKMDLATTSHNERHGIEPQAFGGGGGAAESKDAPLESGGTRAKTGNSKLETGN